MREREELIVLLDDCGVSNARVIVDKLDAYLLKQFGFRCSVCGAEETPLDGCRGTKGPCILRREIPK